MKPQFRGRVPFAFACAGIIALLPMGALSSQAAPTHPTSARPAATIAKPAGRPNSIAHKYSSGRLLFAHTVRASGHVRGTSVFNAHATAIVRKQMHADNPTRVAVFGHIVSMSGRDLIMRELPWAAKGLHGGSIRYKDASGPLGKNGVLVDVRITARTMVQDTNGLIGLHKGMTIVVGGALQNHVVSAIVIADVGPKATIHSRGFGVFHALSGARMRLPARSSVRTALPHRRYHALDSSTNLGFEGGFGAPSFNYNTTMDVTLFDAYLVKVKLTQFSFLAAADGYTWNWPFTFTGTAPSPLTMTEPGTVNLNVQPQDGGTGTYSDTFSGGLGFNIGVTFTLWTRFGCGSFPYTDSCNFDKTVNLGLLSMVNATQAKAPMAGQVLSVPALECPGVGVGIPDTKINAAELDVCSSFKFTGANFSGHVAAADASGAVMNPVDLSFDGTNSQAVSLTPTTANADLTMSNFSWVPTLDYGLFARFKVATVSVWDSPSVTLTSGPFPMIADPATLAAAGFTNLSGRPAQPTSTDFLFTAQKAVTNIAYTGPTSGDYHDSSTVSATLTDNLGTPLSGKQLSFALNGSATETCQAMTDPSGAASCAITPTDVPAAGSLSISFAGDSQYFASNTTPAFTILREDSALSIAGDTSGTYGGTVGLNGTLTEDSGAAAGDTTGPGIDAQPVNFNLGSQNCVPQPSTSASGYASCSITPLQPAGQYTAADVFSGDAYYQSSQNSQSVSLAAQRATVTLDASDANPVKVDSAGGTASPTMGATIANTLPAGDIGNATVTYTLAPVGPGTTYTCTITPTVAKQPDGSYTESGYTTSGPCDSSATTQTFNTARSSVDDVVRFTGVQTNVYTLAVTVSGSYYSGGPATGVTTIYDPSLGFTTGGGTVTNPVTGYKANFGFTAKYLKSGNVQGNVVYVEHRPSGDVILKSNAMGSMTLANTSAPNPPYIAYIQGKATYQGTGNYSFMVTAIDNGEPGINNDQFGLQVKDPTGTLVSDLTFPTTGTSTDAPRIAGGNIAVPHQ